MQPKDKESGVRKKMKEFLAALSCLLNCSISSSEEVEVMNLLEKNDDIADLQDRKWKKYGDTQNHRQAALKDAKRLYKLLFPPRNK